jgi:hypothetical protein
MAEAKDTEQVLKFNSSSHHSCSPFNNNVTEMKYL